jgi:serine phosphatase RsbU (regulator of sigma subunit)
MTNHTSEHTAVTARKRLVAGVLAGGCTLALACIPAAMAKSDHAKPGSGTSAPSAPASTTSAPSTSAPNASAPTSAGSASGSPASSHAGRHSKAEADKPAPQGSAPPGAHPKEPAANTPSTPQPAGKHHGKGTPADGSSRKHAAGFEPAASKDATAAPETAAKNGSGSGELASKPKPKPKPKKPPHGKTGKPPPPRETAPPEVTAPSVSTVSSPLTSTAAPIASAAVAPPSLPVGPSPPSVAGNSAQAERRVGHARGGHSVRGRVGPGAPSTVTPAPVLALAGAPSHAGAKHSRGAVRARPARTRPSQLVTTITRIVGVVPMPVRILIGMLLALALVLAIRSRLVAMRARRLEQQRGQLLEDVGLLQAALLPVPPARLGPVGTSAAYRPADGPGAGGDFYDVFALEDGQLGVIVGDVSGHGRQALPHTALVRFTLRAYLEAGLSPRAAVQTAGAVLDHQLGGSFATVVAATYEPRERVLVYACAGHPSPVVLASEEDSRSIVAVTVCSAPPIGIGMRTGTRQTVVSVPGSSQVCFYTDGVTEARVGAELFGAERLARALAELGPRATASELLDRVSEEADRRPDDMAACLLSVEGAAAAPRVLVEELELGREDATSERTEQFLLACGLGRREIDELVHAVRAAAGRSGTVVLEAHLDGATPRVVLQHDNVAFLHTRLDRTPTNLVVSR